MKKTLLFFVALFAFSAMTNAQEGMKAIKKATRNLSSFNMDPNANADKLTKALELVTKGFETEEVKTNPKALIAKGNILAALANQTINSAILNPESAKGADFTVAIQAFQALQKAYELAPKKWMKRDVVKALTKLEPLLDNMGIIAYQNKSWGSAFKSFKGLMDAGSFLKGLGKKSIVDDKKMKDLMVNSISVGSQENSGVDIAPMLEKAIGMNIQEPNLYSIAYKTFLKTDKAKAVDYLMKGSKLFPTNSNLLFTTINHYIGEGKLELLIGKLKDAIKAEPENASVYSTLGNVYDQLYVKESDSKDKTKANEYFQGALEYYTKATEKDPKAYNAYYGIGALYFNKAAAVGKQLNELSNDYSAEGIKKYDDMKAKMNGFYEESFPYLQKAESIKPKDVLVLQALREYYARTGKNDKAKEYKAKFEAANAENK